MTLVRSLKGSKRIPEGRWQYVEMKGSEGMMEGGEIESALNVSGGIPEGNPSLVSRRSKRWLRVSSSNTSSDLNATIDALLASIRFNCFDVTTSFCGSLHHFSPKQRCNIITEPSFDEESIDMSLCEKEQDNTLCSCMLKVRVTQPLSRCHIFTVASAEPDNPNSSLLAKQQQYTWSKWPSNLRNIVPDFTFQRINVRS